MKVFTPLYPHIVQCVQFMNATDLQYMLTVTRHVQQLTVTRHVQQCTTIHILSLLSAQK